MSKPIRRITLLIGFKCCVVMRFLMPIIFMIIFMVAASFSNTYAQNAAQISETITATITATMMPGTYSSRGADTCLKCHDETDGEHKILDIFKTKHGRAADERTPLAGLQCEACHGPGVAGADALAEVIRRGGHTGKVLGNDMRPPIISFGAKAKTPFDVQNKMCANCHETQDHIGALGIAHNRRDVGCASCHKVHIEQDPVLGKKTQAAVCYGCHLRERAEFAKPSAHPVNEGKMSCDDCHSAHGPTTRDILKKPTVNQTCYTCHAEKRGPLLWEHAPVTEDCNLCHQPHGSIHPNILTKRAPMLCQQCHAQNGHPSVALTDQGLVMGSRPSAMLLGRSCVNCHVQVHGSNHPSGVKLMR